MIVLDDDRQLSQAVADMSGPAFLAELEELQCLLTEAINRHLARAGEYRASFTAGSPFPNLVIDNFLPTAVAEALAETFPSPESPVWTKQPTDDQRFKLATRDEGVIPALQRYILFTLNSGTFVRFIENVTGIEALIADTKLVGGGLHQILPGGKLAVHIDYSHHPQNHLFRRINALLYLNPDWREEYGGHLELWDTQISRCVTKILPVFNRLAMFATSDVSYHGHPEPLTSPSHISRRSLSLYYFTKEPPVGKESVEHNTLFRSRPGDALNVGNLIVRAASSGVVRDLIPPILYKSIRQLWNRQFTGK